MASHSLAIAKAALAAGMMRPEPTSVPRNEIAHFHVLLEAVLKQGSSTNIQLCKEWLLKNIIPSAARTKAIGRYLLALSESAVQTTEGEAYNQPLEKGTPARRRQLNILYLLNDVLHHTKHHHDSALPYSVLTAKLQSFLVDLFGTVSMYNPGVYAKHHKRIQDLLDIWEAQGYYSLLYVQKLRETVVNAARIGYSNSEEGTKLSNGTPQESSGGEKKDVPFIMPASHGDPATPFYDLPAGNMMPHIMPNSSVPINPQLVKPLQLVAGPANDNLVTAIKDLLNDVDASSLEDFQDEGMDMDELGQPVLRDDITGDIVEGEGYYGWSRVFCERMKRKGQEGVDAWRFVSHSGGAERGLSPLRPRKRGYSDSGSSTSNGRSPSRFEQPRISTPRSRSTSRGSNPRLRAFRGRRPYRSLRSRSHSRFRSTSTSRSPSYSPPQTLPAFEHIPTTASQASGQPPIQMQEQGPSPPPPLSLPLQFSQGFPLGPSGIPIPPPPPPNYKGTWPPPPPPPTGPRNFQTQNHGPHPQGPHPVYQDRVPPNFGAWAQQQQQQLGGGPPDGGININAQLPLNRNFQRGRGRGYGRGGWAG